MENKQWNIYEKGKQYNSQYRTNRDLYDAIKAYYDFYYGDQWRNETSEDLPKPVFNIIKRVVDFKVASLMSTKKTIAVEDREEINDLLDKVMENVNYQQLLKNCCLDGAISGDMCLHFTYDGTKADETGIQVEQIDGINVLFGNPNIKDINKQPYIALVGRDTVENLQEEAKEKTEIQSDNDTEYQANEYTEIQGDDNNKALYLVVYMKTKKGILASKYTKDATIYESIPTGMSVYPVAFDNWYSFKNSYHGIGELEGILPNQILINKLFAMATLHTIQTAFPTAVFDKDMLTDGWDNTIGAQIPLSGLKGQSIQSVAGYIQPAQMGSYVINMIELAMAYTKDMMGVSDASLGNIDPKNTSAIVAVQKSAIIPLENVKTNLYAFVEQCGRIIIDMLRVKTNLITDLAENTHLQIDIGDGSYFNEISQMQTLDNLLMNQQITFKQYLERVPDKFVPDKQGLLNEIAGQIQAQQEDYEAMAQFIEGLPPETQAQLQAMEPQAMEEAVKQMMSQQV